LKRTLLYITLLFTITVVNGQSSFDDDTIKIKEVIITSKKVISDHPGYKKTLIDSSILKNYSQGTVADILSENTGIFVKSYGLGGTATPCFRGTGASHTQIAWNGININHPMIGQSDLSLLPAGLIDDIQILYGGASMELNSGGIGGIINMETKPVWNKETIISLNSGVGSFGRYTGLLSAKSGNVNFQSVTKAFFQSAENDFRYLNDQSSSIPTWETRKNNQASQQGFVQELYYLKSNNVASARIWYQSARRNLPSSMLSQQTGSGESQSDESLRIMLNYDINNQRDIYSITGAWLFNRLDYSNPLASIESKNISDILTLKAGMERRISVNTTLKIVLNDEMNVVKSNNYDQTSTRNTTSLTASAEYNGTNRFGTTFLIREILEKNKLLIPDFSAGLQLRLVDAKDYFLKANISRNSKIPSMNDLFWVPGGNPELKNEYAYIYELTFEMAHKTLTPLLFNYNLSVFRNTIKDMIQWRPGLYSVWTAENVQNVNTAGLESSFSVKYKLNNLTSEFNAGYSFTKAIEVTSDENNYEHKGNQLMYIPEHQLNSSLRFCYKNFYSSFYTNITGKRYINVDNSRYLPGYCINSVAAGYKIKLKNILLDLNFDIDNLLNINYQSIAYYPLPGRAYTFKLLFQIAK
jgi:vitamin B12 transporter